MSPRRWIHWKKSLQYRYQVSPIFFSLMKRFVLPVLQQVRNPAFPYPFFFSFHWDKSTGNVFFFFKPDYFMCQSTILGKKKRFPRSVLCSAKSVNKQTKKNNKSHLFLNKRNLSYKKGLEAMNWQVTGRDSCLNIWNTGLSFIKCIYLCSNMHLLVTWSCC